MVIELIPGHEPIYEPYTTTPITPHLIERKGDYISRVIVICQEIPLP